MVQTRQRATSSAQSDPPAPTPQRHRYVTRSVSRAESSDLQQHADRDGGNNEVSSAPPRSPAPPAATRRGRGKQQQEADAAVAAAAAEEEEDLKQQQRRRPALDPVAEEAADEEEDAEEGGGDSGDNGGGGGGATSSSGGGEEEEEEEEDQDASEAGASEEEEADDEEEAMLQGLAASIAAAFKQKQPAATAAAAAAAAAKGNGAKAGAAASSSSGEEQEDDSDDDDADAPSQTKTAKVGLWLPSTGLKPAPPAARVALQQLGVQTAAAKAKPNSGGGGAGGGGGSGSSTNPLRPAGLSAAAGRAAPLDPKTAAKAAREQAASRPDTAGPRWYDLPATPITDDVKRELRLLRLRGAYDPKRFYRSYDGGRFPRYFAVATVQDDPLEPASSRMSRRERRRATITEQLLADDHLSGARKRRFDRLQDEAARLAGMGKSGERGLAAAASKRQRKSSQPRLPKSHHRPKH